MYRKSSLATLLLLVIFTTACPWKQAATATLPHLCNLLSSSREGKVRDLGAAVCSYQSDLSESAYERTINAFDAALASHELSPATKEIIALGKSVLRVFAPATAAEMDPNSEDARAARKDLEAKFRELKERLKASAR